MKKKPTMAPGSEDFMKKDASSKERRKGKFTRVTTLSYDEVDPS